MKLEPIAPFVTRFYSQVLGRTISPSELAQYEAGTTDTPATLAKKLFESPEGLSAAKPRLF